MKNKYKILWSTIFIILSVFLFSVIYLAYKYDDNPELSENMRLFAIEEYKSRQNFDFDKYKDPKYANSQCDIYDNKVHKNASGYFENGNIKISGSLYIPAHQFEDKSIEGICILEKGKDNKSFVTVQDKLGINESIFKDSTGILLVSEIKNVDIKNRKLTLSVFDKREFADQSRVDAAFLDGKPSEDFEAFFRKHIRDVELDF